ncbi:MAG TPA: hypothetical protein VKW08_07930 [Xanthobacteraceae bacterium]|nr:hypothetical protein [Xanthobacteraceae bacterium]
MSERIPISVRMAAARARSGLPRFVQYRQKERINFVIPSISLPQDVAAAWIKQAQDRKLRLSGLIRVVLEMIADESLFAAILQDEEPELESMPGRRPEGDSRVTNRSVKSPISTGERVR